MKKLLVLFALCFCLTGIFSAALAVEPGEMLKDPALEKRARLISRELRCLVCQGQDIDSSEAPLAADIRRLVRDRLKAGDTDAQVFDYIRARYGDYVLMSPPVQSDTALLWSAPLLVLLAGLGVAGGYLRGRMRVPAGPEETPPEEGKDE
jgi:cytochrome c-type biogenesis protein CcmH